MRIFNGKKLADKILLDLKNKIKKENLKLTLAVISVGQNLASELFIRNKKKAAQKIGLKILHYHFGEKIKQKRIIDLIKKLNQDKSINGIIVQLPLPRKFNTSKIIQLISAEKDVDGFTPQSYFQPPLISAILTALKKALSLKQLTKKKIVALVNSDIFGQTLKRYLKKEGLKIIYLKKPFKTLKPVKSADVIISVCGQPHFIKSEIIKDKVILIDGGITVLPKKGVVGDVDQFSVAEKAQFLTPVPKGLGPLTIAFLFKNIYEGYQFSQNN